MVLLAHVDLSRTAPLGRSDEALPVTGWPRTVLGLVLLDRQSSSSRFREHATLDGLITACGLALDTPLVREPHGSMRCSRCVRVAIALSQTPVPIPRTTATDLNALTRFLAEALVELGEPADTARNAHALAGRAISPVTLGISNLIGAVNNLGAKRLLALAIAVIRGRRTVRELQALRQELIYGP